MYVLLLCDFDNALIMVIAAMRRVLHLKQVTQCAMLENFGIFLVLADKVFLPSSLLQHATDSLYDSRYLLTT